MLTRAGAHRMCELVSKDVGCQALLTAPWPPILQSWGVAGSVVNALGTVGTWVGGMDQDDLQLRSCIGISNATSAALSPETVEGSTASNGYLPEVQLAITCTRFPKDFLGNTWEHHACRIIMVDGSDYVMDWWKTLDPWNPYIYATDDWRQDNSNYFPFSSFTGVGGPAPASGASPPSPDPPEC